MLQVVISIIFIFYFFLFYVVTGIWGTVVLSSACKSLSLRTAIRGVIVVGAIGMTSLVGNSICHSQCRTTSHEELPNWLLYFLFILCIVGMVFLVNMLGQLGKEKLCQNSSLKNYTGICIGMNSIVLLVLFIGIVYRFRKRGEKKEAEKAKKVKEETKKRLVEERDEITKKNKAKQQNEDIESLKRQIADLKSKSETKPEKSDNNIDVDVLREELKNLQAKALATKLENKYDGNEILDTLGPKVNNALKDHETKHPDSTLRARIHEGKAAGKLKLSRRASDDSFINRVGQIVEDTVSSSSMPGLEAGSVSSGASHTVSAGPSPLASPAGATVKKEYNFPINKNKI